MNERQACVAFNHLLSQDGGEETLALSLGAALEARGLSLPTPILAELVALGPIFDTGQLREVRGIGPVRHRQLVEALAQITPEEDEAPEPWSPSIPAEVFDELDALDPEALAPLAAAEGAPPEAKVEPAPAERAPASAPDPGEQAESVILRHVTLAAGTGLVPFPLADMAALLAVNVHMVRQLARLHGVDVQEHRVRVAVSSLLAAAGVPALMLPVSSLLRAVPGLGWAFGALATPSLAGTLTYATGRVFTRHFSAGGGVEDFDVRRGRGTLRQEMAEGAKA
ncbi:MAG: DUF697 domain-containing protein [Alphaproteobacteria bacterium]|nr:DUF697 domain-containing protein [Alphaproteobacteria bacterium]MCB9792393.1 DUF697 domain-containing protein [Alphaproteobacteria bacterium]